MNITEAAERYGVSVQALYAKMKKRGISPASIKIEGSDQISADGEAVLEKLYGGAVKQQRQNQSDRIRQLENANAVLEKDNAVLKAQLEGVTRELETMRSTLEIERALFTRALPADTTKPGFFQRIKQAMKR